MIYKRFKLWTILAFTTVLLSPAAVQGQDYQLMVRPAKCVSLTQGNVCYQTVSFHWQAPAEVNMCLFRQEQELPLKCWEEAKQGNFKHEFASDRSQRYQLRLRNEEAVLVETVVEVKWVYKGRQNNRYGWRVF